MRISVLFIVIVLVLFSGCYYGSMIGAHTLGEDHMTITGGVALPTYLNADERREASDSGVDDVPVSPSITFMSGATSNIDVGIAARAYGIGPLVRVGLLPNNDKLALSLLSGASYVVPAKLLATNFGISLGYILGNSLETYTGWYGGYGPDVINLQEDSAGNATWDEVDNIFYHSISAGLVYELPAHNEEWIPESLCFEFSAPLNFTRKLIMFGLAVSY